MTTQVETAYKVKSWLFWLNRLIRDLWGSKIHHGHVRNTFLSFIAAIQYSFHGLGKETGKYFRMNKMKGESLWSNADLHSVYQHCLESPISRCRFCRFESLVFYKSLVTTRDISCIVADWWSVQDVLGSA